MITKVLSLFRTFINGLHPKVFAFKVLQYFLYVFWLLTYNLVPFLTKYLNKYGQINKTFYGGAIPLFLNR
jgi:hypothetical protein